MSGCIKIVYKGQSLTTVSISFGTVFLFLLVSSRETIDPQGPFFQCDGQELATSFIGLLALIVRLHGLVPALSPSQYRFQKDVMGMVVDLQTNIPDVGIYIWDHKGDSSTSNTQRAFGVFSCLSAKDRGLFFR